MNKKLNVIVCGTSFGEKYIQALKTLEDRVNFVGILARGSQRSRELAEKYGVGFYDCAAHLPSDIDFACVVVRTEGTGGRGTELCIELLNKNINVIQEQPVFPSHLEKCYKLAKKKGLLYMTANLYSKLAVVKSFIDSARKQNKLSKLEYVNASFSTQISYTAIDILSLAGISGIMRLNKEVIKALGPFDILNGEIGNVPVLIEFNNRINPVSLDYSMHLLHCFRFYYDDGILALDDTFGQVVWRPRLFINMEADHEFTGKEPAYKIIKKSEERTVKEIVSSDWIAAIAEEVMELIEAIENKTLNYNRVNRELNVSKKWENLQTIAGYAEFYSD